jgi:hypothetical protein
LHRIFLPEQIQRKFIDGQTISTLEIGKFARISGFSYKSGPDLTTTMRKIYRGWQMIKRMGDVKKCINLNLTYFYPI